MESWKTRKNQRATRQPGVLGIAGIIMRSIWHQGIKSDYRSAYWKYQFRMVTHYAFNPAKIWMASTVMISGHHFIPYSRQVVAGIERQIERVETLQELVPATAAD
jgi:hypothetical protein